MVQHTVRITNVTCNIPGELTYNLLTIDLLDAPAVVLRQLEIFCLHPLVKGGHDGQRIVGVL